MKEETNTRLATLRYSFLSTLPVMAGYVVLGIGFGLLMYDKGYSFWWSVLMSITIYGGSMQYVGVSLLSGGASVITTALTALMVQARHLFYGISMLDKYRNTGKGKPYLIFALTDETYSLVCSPELPQGVDKRGYYYLVSFFDQCYWVLGSFLGGVAGSAFPFSTAGIDFSMTALFVVVFVEQWEGTKNHVPALLGLGCAIGCLLLFGADQFLIPTMIAITLGLFIARPWMEKGGKNCESC
jgi:4-azaleucine resistance transporter AzlC